MKKEYGRSFQILNLIGCFFIFGLCVTIILLIDSKSLFWGKVTPIIISFILVSIYGKLMEMLISRRYRYSWVRSINKKHSDDNGSYNLYKVDPYYEDKGMTGYQYSRMKRFRLTNFFIYLLASSVLIMGLIDFSGTLFHDIILPIIMIVCGCGVLFVLVDFIEEALIKRFYVKRKKIDEVVQNSKKDSIYNKNLRIYYIPICLFIGIIIVMIVVDFSKSIAYITQRILIITAIILFFIVILDLTISRITRNLRVLDEESQKTIDSDLSAVIDEEIGKEKERDNNEV